MHSLTAFYGFVRWHVSALWVDSEAVTLHGQGFRQRQFQLFYYHDLSSALVTLNFDLYNNDIHGSFKQYSTAQSLRNLERYPCTISSQRRNEWHGIWKPQHIQRRQFRVC
jgi:hypothetical protein